MDLAFAGLPHAIRTGEPGYASVHGREFWADLDADPGHRAYFDELMRSQQLFTAPQVAELYPWQQVDHVTDVGGGSGGLLAELLASHPHLQRPAGGPSGAGGHRGRTVRRARGGRTGRGGGR